MICQCERCGNERECRFSPLACPAENPEQHEEIAGAHGVWLCAFCGEWFEAELESAVELMKKEFGEPGGEN